MTRPAYLTAIKIAHTIVWAFFAGCTLAIPLAAWRGKLLAAMWLALIVLGEVAVLALNRWKCPLTSVAARYTADRRANFDIYLPQWLARNNKTLFGLIFVVGVALTLAQWLRTAT